MTLTVTAANYDPEVEAVQSRLTALGYDPGPSDGLMGPRTRAAIEAFRTDRGLAPSRRIDTTLREALGLVHPSDPSPEVGTAPEPEPETQPEPEAEVEATTPGPPPAPAERPGLITYARLGWAGPESGSSALARFRASGDSPIRGRVSGELIVPSGTRVYVLEHGQHIAGLNCDPAAGRLRVEPMFDLDGPLSFVSRDERGMCQLGFGVVLMLGGTLHMEAFAWGDVTWPAGDVRLAPEGLQYLTPK